MSDDTSTRLYIPLLRKLYTLAYISCVFWSSYSLLQAFGDETPVSRVSGDPLARLNFGYHSDGETEGELLQKTRHKREHLLTSH